MNRKFRLVIVALAFVLSTIVVSNQYVLSLLNSDYFFNWKNDSLFYVISIILWAVILPFFYDLVKRISLNSGRFILYLITSSLVLSFFHQVLANLIFTVIQVLFANAEKTSFDTHIFFRLVLGGLLSRFLESVFFAVFFYVILKYNDAIIKFISTNVPKVYKWILGDSVLSQLTLTERGITISINKDEIIRFESEGNYTKVVTTDKIYLPRIGISKLADDLDPSLFIQIHRSNILNRNCVSKVSYFKNGEYKIDLINGDSVNSSRKYSTQLKIVFKDFLVGSHISSQN